MGGIDSKGRQTNHVYKLKEDQWDRVYPNLPLKVGGKANLAFHIWNEFLQRENP